MTDTTQTGRTGLVWSPTFTDHRPSWDHPESPDRYNAIRRALGATTLPQQVEQIAPRAATLDEILLCHDPDYVHLAEGEIRAGRPILSTGDTDVCTRSFDVALTAVGAAITAVDLVMEGRCPNAFSLVRPPGHHAGPASGEGFCIFNNIAVAARYAQQRHGVERVLIVDWDVHHGNGTQDIFYRDGSVFYFSTHQSPWYPGTGKPYEKGEGAGVGTTMNCPFPAGSGAAEIVGALREKLAPAMETFRPDLVMISAGFDARAGDPLGRFLLNDDDFAEMTRILGEVADRHAGGRLISVLEGGYNLEGLGRGVVAHLGALVALTNG